MAIKVLFPTSCDTDKTKLHSTSTPCSVKDTLLCCALITGVNYRCANFYALYKVDKWIIVILYPQLIYFAHVVYLPNVCLVTVIVLPWLALGHLLNGAVCPHSSHLCVKYKPWLDQWSNTGDIFDSCISGKLDKRPLHAQVHFLSVMPMVGMQLLRGK